MTEFTCPECGAPAKPEHRITIGGRTPYRCENGHTLVDMDEEPHGIGKDVPVRMRGDEAA